MSPVRPSPLLFLVLGIAACGGGEAPRQDFVAQQPPAPGPGGLPQVVITTDSDGAFRPPLGGPIDGLTPSELAAFERGRLVFSRRFTPGTGLGPLYNATSCASCHSTPVPGGSAQLYRNFYVAHYAASASQQFPLPGLPSLVIPAFGKTPTFTTSTGRYVIPDTVGFGWPVISAQRNAPPAFGTGLFEFVSNATIQANADPEDLDGDGVSGRYNQDPVGLGRFGWKAQVNNLELFTRAPLFNQMGITSQPFQGSGATVSLAAPQGGSDPNSSTTDSDGIPDPEIGFNDLGDLIAFTRFLAPPERARPASDAAVSGEALFDAVGCTKCHVPTLASSRGPVHAYTDLLLHDMGPDLADNLFLGAPQASPSSPTNTGSEWRTAPLWGVSLHGPYLHDGRAETLREAILLHAGEASGVTAAFLGLEVIEQNQILEFLRIL
jgi:CxxC motif-containing protein (DUF1111 family)